MYAAGNGLSELRHFQPIWPMSTHQDAQVVGDDLAQHFIDLSDFKLSLRSESPNLALIMLNVVSTFDRLW